MGELRLYKLSVNEERLTYHEVYAHSKAEAIRQVEAAPVATRTRATVPHRSRPVVYEPR